jgi:hypothetical protein
VFPNLGRLDKPMSKSTLNVMFDRLKLEVTPHAVRDRIDAAERKWSVSR